MLTYSYNQHFSPAELEDPEFSYETLVLTQPLMCNFCFVQ